MKTDISIIIITFNSSGFIRGCLDSVFAQDCRDFEVIVVDNGSRDDTLKIIKESYPRARLIENKTNLGPAKARNQGIGAAGGKWVVTLDCDIILAGDFIPEIIRAIGKVPETVGIIQPKILKADKERIYSAGIRVSFLRRFHDIGRGRMDSAGFNKERYVTGACSAAAAYKKENLETLKDANGYFDERFFFLLEDADLAWRFQKKGIKAIFYPGARCYHSGDSSGTPKKIRQYLCLRNRYFTLLKNDSLARLVLPFFIYDIPRLLYLSITNPRALKGAAEAFGYAKP